MDKTFFPAERFYAILQEHQLTDILQVTPAEPFLVETAFMQYWNDLLRGSPAADDDVQIDAYPMRGNSGVAIWVTYDIDSVRSEGIGFYMTPNANYPRKYALLIIYDDNIFYERTASQDPATQWSINCMANDLTDENGKFIFQGAPYRSYTAQT